MEEIKGQKYEFSFWFTSKISELEAETYFNELLEKLESFGAQIITTQLPHLKLLAYPIKKETSSYFGFIQFSLGAEDLENFKKNLQFEEKILRFIIVRIKKKEKAKTPSKGKRAVYQRAEIKEQKPEEISLEELDKKLSEILKE